MRVVSLLPSATEMVYAVGAEPVGVSHECDYPPDARTKPSVTSTRVDPEGTSGEINESVAEARDGEGVYGIDVETLDTLNPDVVITQGVCDVCAVGNDAVRRGVEEIEASPEILTLHSHTLDGVLDDIRTVGDAVGCGNKARKVVDDLRDRLEDVRETTSGFDEKDVVILDWLEPPMVAGHWVPELVEVAGGTYPLASPGDVSTVRDWDEIRDAEPEVVVAAPCGFELAKTVRCFDEVSERDGWDALPAVREGRAYAADGNGYFNRPGPRLVDTAEALACAVHDELGPPPSDVAATPVRIR